MNPSILQEISQIRSLAQEVAQEEAFVAQKLQQVIQRSARVEQSLASISGVPVPVVGTVGYNAAWTPGLASPTVFTSGVPTTNTYM